MLHIQVLGKSIRFFIKCFYWSSPWFFQIGLEWSNLLAKSYTYGLAYRCSSSEPVRRWLGINFVRDTDLFSLCVGAGLMCIISPLVWEFVRFKY